MSDPRVLKGTGYVLLAVTLVLLAVAIFRDGNNTNLAFLATIPAFVAVGLFVKTDPQRYRKGRT